MDLFNKKSCQTMALMFNLPMLMTAMGLWDSSNTIGHTASSAKSYADFWSEPFDPAFHPQEISQMAEEYTSAMLFDDPKTLPTSTNDLPTTSAGHFPPVDDLDTHAFTKKVSERFSGVSRRSRQNQSLIILFVQFPLLQSLPKVLSLLGK